MPHPPPRAVVHRLDLEDVDRAVDSPALAALLAEGWTIATSFAGAEEGKPRLFVVLAPPRVPRVVAAVAWRWAVAGAVAGAAVAGAVAAVAG